MLVVRSLYALKTTNALVFFSGFVEPVFYLVAFGFGVGNLVGGSSLGGDATAYARFLAPALLATSAMNGAIADSTWNVFFKMHFGKTYQGMMSTSLGALDVALGEITWALLRGLTYANGFFWQSASGGKVYRVDPSSGAILDSVIFLSAEPRKSWVLGRIPAGRFGAPVDVAPTAIYLAGGASDFVTGQVIAVDGGWLAR